MAGSLVSAKAAAQRLCRVGRGGDGCASDKESFRRCRASAFCVSGAKKMGSGWLTSAGDSLWSQVPRSARAVRIAAVKRRDGVVDCAWAMAMGMAMGMAMQHTEVELPRQ
uniref:Uncharacterized protein n=1 Tax=Erythrolobus australicus TaxID=1077150 RepID=A0A7S1XJ99_9RHOD|mmetsp:Transcript_4969/g.13374  ORF Transcript_4969/g.13374 Transcript_4969/m.13374 type:complete len:110 (+) Transcript_4969:195-524(+)